MHIHIPKPWFEINLPQHNLPETQCESWIVSILPPSWLASCYTSQKHMSKPQKRPWAASKRVNVCVFAACWCMNCFHDEHNSCLCHPREQPVISVCKAVVALKLNARVGPPCQGLQPTKLNEVHLDRFLSQCGLNVISASTSLRNTSVKKRLQAFVRVCPSCKLKKIQIRAHVLATTILPDEMILEQISSSSRSLLCSWSWPFHLLAEECEEKTEHA